MRWLRVIQRWFRRDRLGRDIDDELALHLEFRERELIEQGLSPEQARREARLRFGNGTLAKEDSRAVWTLMWLESLWRDLRHASLVLANNPGFTAIAVVSLAVGIGASTAIFTVTDEVLLRPLPVEAPEQLVQIATRFPGGQLSRVESFAAFEAYRQEAGEVLSGIFAFARMGSFPNVIVGGNGSAVAHLYASGEMYSVLGVKPALGRLFTSEEDRGENCCPVAVLSYPYWQRRFGGDPSIIGQSLMVNNQPLTVIGVTPPEFKGVALGLAPDITLPIMMTSLYGATGRTTLLDLTWGKILARKRPGISDERVRATLAPLYAAQRQRLLNEVSGPFWEAARADIAKMQLEILPAARGASAGARDDLKSPLLVLMAAVGLLLLIASVNLANLLLVKATGRRKEISVRLALGAGRARVVRQLLTESFLLAAAGGGLGVLAAVWGAPLLARLVAGDAIIASLKLTPDWRTLGFALAATFLTAAAFGLAPALRASDLDLSAAIKSGSSRDSYGGKRRQSGTRLIALQLALSLPLLFVAGVFGRNLSRLLDLDTGYVPENVLSAELNPSGAGYRDARLKNYWSSVLDRVRSIPGVRSATLSTTPMGSGSYGQFLIRVPGREPRPHDAPHMNKIAPRFVETLGLTLLKGRDVSDRDTEGMPQVALVNESFGRYFFGNADPLDKTFSIQLSSREDVRQVVGVIRDARDGGPNQPAEPYFYVPYMQWGSTRSAAIMVRTLTPPVSAAASLRSALSGVDPEVPLTGVATLELKTRERLAHEYALATLSALFGAVVLLLVCIGLYGVLSYATQRRTKEIGLRMSLGALRTDIAKLILQQAAIPVATGLAIGAAGCFLVGRLLASMLLSPELLDIPSLAAAILLLSAAAAAASYLPAARASRVNPVDALRHE